MAATGARNDPYSAFNFIVEIDGVVVGGLRRVRRAHDRDRHHRVPQRATRTSPSASCPAWRSTPTSASSAATPTRPRAVGVAQDGHGRQDAAQVAGPSRCSTRRASRRCSGTSARAGRRSGRARRSTPRTTRSRSRRSRSPSKDSCSNDAYRRRRHGPADAGPDDRARTCGRAAARAGRLGRVAGSGVPRAGGAAQRRRRLRRPRRPRVRSTRAKRLASAAEFDSVYGPPQPGMFLAAAVHGFFANGGTTCWVVRAADRGTRAAGQSRARGPAPASRSRPRARAPGPTASWSTCSRRAAAVTVDGGRTGRPARGVAAASTSTACAQHFGDDGAPFRRQRLRTRQRPARRPDTTLPATASRARPRRRGRRAEGLTPGAPHR